MVIQNIMEIVYKPVHFFLSGGTPQKPVSGYAELSLSQIILAYNLKFMKFFLFFLMLTQYLKK